MEKERREKGELKAGTGEEKKEKKKNGEGPRFHRKFVFKERDQKALKWIAEQGVGTVDQLWWAAWKNEESKSSKYADQRLRDMAKGGYLKRERVFGSGVTNYIITQKGRYLVEEAYPDRKDFLPPVPKRVNDGQYRHTMALNWCRLFLEKENPIQNWMSDRAIQSSLKRKDKGEFIPWIEAVERISPDASFEYCGERWLFEYEATQKNQTKYEEKAKVLPWSQSESIQGVIFVAATPNLKAVLKKYFYNRTCVLFTLDELKHGDVTSFLKEVRKQKETEERERQRFLEERRFEKEAKLPVLQVRLEQLESSQERLVAQIEASEREKRAQLEAYSRFEESFIKLPGQRDALIKKNFQISSELSDLQNRKWDFDKKLSDCKNEIKQLEQF